MYPDKAMIELNRLFHAKLNVEDKKIVINNKVRPTRCIKIFLDLLVFTYCEKTEQFFGG